MKRVITLILDKSWSTATVEVGADGNIVEEHIGIDASNALAKFGQSIDDQKED